MNSSKIYKEKDVIVLEIQPENPTLKLVYSIVLAVLVILGLALIGYATYKYMNQAFWWDGKLILAALVYFFALFIFGRHWLWFNLGKEVAIIYKDKLVYYRDLKFFAEGKVKPNYKKIEVIYRKDESDVKDEYDKNLVDDLLSKKESAIVGFRIDDKEVISTHLPISIEEIRNLTRLVN